MFIKQHKTNRFALSVLAAGIAFASHSASAQSASCEYIVDNDWGSGAVATVRLTNTGSSSINGWNVEWAYDNNSVAHAWSANLSGSNPYSASNMEWNGDIPPGGVVEFGMQVNSSGPAETPEVTGDICGDSDDDDDNGNGDDNGDDNGNGGDPTAGVFRVDDNGNITKNGDVMPVQCGSWFGLEGRHEPEDDPDNPGGAPMELFVGNMWWANDGQGTGRTIQQTMEEIKDLGINVVRLPIAPQTLNPNDPQSSGPGILKNHESVRQDNARQAMEDFIVQAAQNDIQVIVGIHSCSNYLGWRAGRLDATPPYADTDRLGYEYFRDGYACGSEGVGPDVIVHEYNEALWLNDLREIAQLEQDLGVDNILGIDIFNEPWDYTWDEWKGMVERAYDAINEVNENTLIVVQGIGSYNSDGTDIPHGDPAYNPNWGENFYSFADSPIDIPRDRLVISPHTYGPSVFVQNHFLDPSQPECAELEGHEAGEAGCNVVLNTATLRAGWDQHFGYLAGQGYAILVGEFGGNVDWPLGTRAAEQAVWSHQAPGTDLQWQEMFVDYMVENDMQGCYWSINPESSDTGGLYNHAYEHDTYEEGWGTWLDFDERKTDLLRTLWDQN